MNERIKAIRIGANLSQSEFAKKLSVSRSAICKLENGENSPSEQTIKLICKNFYVNEEWLRTGKGTPYIKRSKEEEITEMLMDVQFGSNDTFKHRFISALAKLDESGWNMLENLIDDLTGQKKSGD